MPSKKSGGKRAVERKHRLREAERKRAGDYDAKWAAEYEKIGEPPADAERSYGWLAHVMVLTIYEAMHDVAMPPEQRREQIGRLVAQAAKVLDPAKLTEELEELERAREELINARTVPAGKDSAASA